MDRKHSCWPVWMGAALVLLPVLYVASLGPAEWAYQHDLLPEPLRGFLGMVYTPLAMVVEHLGLVHWLTWYVELWTG